VHHAACHMPHDALNWSELKSYRILSAVVQLNWFTLSNIRYAWWLVESQTSVYRRTRRCIKRRYRYWLFLLRKKRRFCWVNIQVVRAVICAGSARRSRCRWRHSWWGWWMTTRTRWRRRVVRRPTHPGYLRNTYHFVSAADSSFFSSYNNWLEWCSWHRIINQSFTCLRKKPPKQTR